MGKKAQFRVSYILLYQLIIGLVVSALLLIVSLAACISCLVGVLLIIIANLFVMIRFFGKKDINPREALIRLYTGEIGKFIILAVGIIICAKVLTLTWWAFIIGIICVQLGYCVVPYFMYKRGTLGL